MEWVWSIQNKYYGSLHWKSLTSLPPQQPTDGSDGLKGGDDYHSTFPQQMASMGSHFLTYGVEVNAVCGSEYIQFFVRQPDGSTRWGPAVSPRNGDGMGWDGE